MADKNLAASANDGVASETGTTQGTSSGAVANTNDGDTETYWKRRGYAHNAPEDYVVYGEFTIEVEFVKTVPTLNNIKYWVGWDNYSKGEYSYYRSLSCSLYYSGAWHQIGTSQNSPTTIEGPWQNVNKVKIHMYTWTKRREPYGYEDVWATIILYELEAWGTIHKDIGLRIYNNASVVKVGCQDLDNDSHKLRIRKDGTTYGIELVATDDDQASPVRIYDGANVKALPEVD